MRTGGGGSLMGGHLASGHLSLCGLKVHLSLSQCRAAARHPGGCVHRGSSVMEKQVHPVGGFPGQTSRCPCPLPAPSLERNFSPQAFPERASLIRDVRKCRNKGHLFLNSPARQSSEFSRLTSQGLCVSFKGCGVIARSYRMVSWITL